MLDRLRSLFGVPEAKASRTARVIALETGGRARWTPRDYTALARAGYARNAIVYRAVKLIAESAGSLAFLAYEGAEEQERHPLLDLLARPNPRQDGPALVEAVVTHLLLSGNAYLEAVALEGEPRELYALRPDRMRVVPGPQGWPEAYEYTAAGRTVRFAQNADPVPPILHVAFLHPLDDHYGLAPVEAAAVAVDTHNAAAVWNKALLDNAARPSGALIYTGAGAGLSDAQHEALKRELEAQYQGAANAGRPLLLEGNLDWKAMSLSPRELDFLETKHAAAREIALAFGVPPMLLGIPGDNTYANYQEANRALWRQTVLPLANRLSCALAQWLSPAYGGALRLAVDADRIEALAGDRAGLWERLSAAPFLTVNEKREALGYSPVEGGDALPEAAKGRAEAGAAATLRSQDAERAAPPPGAYARKYSPDQPRVPAGNPDGGQWTNGEENESNNSDAADSDGVPSDEGAVDATDISAAKRGGGIAREFYNFTARQFISRFCKGGINSRFPSEFENMTIGDILDIAQGGDARAKACKKLLSRPEYRK